MASRSSKSGPTPARKNHLSATIETLYQEHGYIISLLDGLEQQTLKLKSGKIPDYQLLLESIDYLTHFPDRYHHPREDLLFAGLLKQNKTFASHMERLQREHVTLRLHNNRLFAELNAAVEGAPVDRPALMRKLQRYIKGYRQHIAYESSEIFPQAKGSLSAAQLGELDQRTRYLDDPLFGDTISRRYHRLGRVLNLRAATLRDEVLGREFSALESVLENLTKVSDMVPPIPSIPSVFRRASATPSWQARAMNIFTRTVMKPALRFGSLESLRAISVHADELGDKNFPSYTKVDPVEGAADNLPGNAWVTTMAGIGSPSDAEKLESPFSHGMKKAFDYLSELLIAQEKAKGIEISKIDYVCPGEIGPWSTMATLLTAAQIGRSVIDADGGGRAYPNLAMTAYAGANVSVNPMTLANDQPEFFPNGTVNTESVTAGFQVQTEDVVESCSRYLLSAPQFNGVAGFSTWAMDVTKFMMEGMAVGQMVTNREERVQRLLNYLGDRLEEIFMEGESGAIGRHST